MLINLQQTVPEFVSSFNHLIDFVPVNEAEKAQARERYKQYRQMGWQLSTEQGKNVVLIGDNNILLYRQIISIKCRVKYSI